MGSLLLTVDIGNTTTHLGAFDGDKLVFSFRLASTHTRTADEAALLLKQVMRENDLAPTAVTGAVTGSVVPVLTPMFEKAILAACGVSPLNVTYQTKSVIRLDFQHPEQVGADRIANAEGFWIEHHSTGIVVDFGTATTFDVISNDGAFLGGAIAPGLETSAERLAAKAAQLPKVGFGPPESPIGRTTEDALRSGVFFAGVGAVDEIVQRIAAALPGKPKVIATGGLAEVIAAESKTIEAIDPILTLKGLKYLYQANS